MSILPSALTLQSLASSHRIIGVGNAGGNFLDRLLMSSPSFSGLIAVNNDAEALAASVVTTQIPLSSAQEPLVALEEMQGRLQEELMGASIVLLCGGLGGRTASTLLPAIAAMSKKLKIVTIACVTRPFSFEGKRVQSVAAESLEALERICDGVILLDNNSFASTNTSAAGLGDTFASSDEAMQICLPGILAMFLNKGPVRITRPQLLAALSRSEAKTYFGYGQATGPNRLHEAMERALKSPLLDRGRALAKAAPIFVLLRGPKDFSFAEAQAAMQEVERMAGENSDIQLSVNADEPNGAALQIFILAIGRGSEKKIEASRPVALPVVKKTQEPLREVVTPTGKPLVPKLSLEMDATEDTSKVPETRMASSLSRSAALVSKPKQTQGALNFTAAQRGRFDKSEPTIVEGEDLDTPTYLRLGLKLTF